MKINFDKRNGFFWPRHPVNKKQAKEQVFIPPAFCRQVAEARDLYEKYGIG